MDNNMETGRERRGNMCMCGNYTCMAHVIRPGDTLYRLSREYGIKVSALMMANPFVDIYNLRVGDELCIPRLRRPENVMPTPRTSGGQNMAQTPRMDAGRASDADSRMMPDVNERMSQGESMYMMPEQNSRMMGGGVNYRTRNEQNTERMRQEEMMGEERVVDAELDMMHDSKGFMESECSKCAGIQFQNHDDTY